MLSSRPLGLQPCFNLSILECKLCHPCTLAAYHLVLIYPYWNVNCGSVWCVGVRTGFNLSILECKCGGITDKYVYVDGFNLSILECKCITTGSMTTTTLVLIYPYWNVNFNIFLLVRHWFQVLIYPYWNVNKVLLRSLHWRDLVLIYPYWNVNHEVENSLEPKSRF